MPAEGWSLPLGDNRSAGSRLSPRTVRGTSPSLPTKPAAPSKQSSRARSPIPPAAAEEEGLSATQAREEIKGAKQDKRWKENGEPEAAVAEKVNARAPAPPQPPSPDSRA